MIKKKIITMWFVPCVLLITFSFVGCGKDKQDEQVSPEPTKIQSFKIAKEEPSHASVTENAAPKDPEQGQKADNGATPLPTAEALEAVSPEGLPAQDVPQADSVVEADQTQEPPKEVPPAEPAPSLNPSEETPEKSATDLSLSPAYAAISSDGQGKGLIYNPEGKLDPFEPLFRAKNEREREIGTKAQTIRDTRRNKLTPLEKMDISQLKLTAIILGQQKNIAMVQESTGKGHVVSKGTYIGINSGRVVEITKNTVIIEEEVEDLLGKIIVRKRELKLQKPLGEM